MVDLSADRDVSPSVSCAQRAGQGAIALLLYFALLVIVAGFPAPAWVFPVLPIPSAILVANALGPRPWSSRVKWKPSRLTYWVLVAALVAPSATLLAVAAQATPPAVDQVMTITCAARSLLHGSDPYLLYEPQCAAELNYRGSALTPLQSGPFSHLHHRPTAKEIKAAELHDQQTGSHAGFPPFGYPPDAILLLLPVAFSNWSAIWLWVACVWIALMLAIWSDGGPPGRAMLVAWQMAAFALLSVGMQWNPEYISYLLLALAFARIDSRQISAVAMAAALGTNQLSWIALPAYLVIIGGEPQLRSRLSWLIGSIAVGFAPWWAWDHSLPIQLVSFLRLPYFPVGTSLGRLARVPLHSSTGYVVGLVAAIAVLTVIAWRCPTWRWALAGVIWVTFTLSDRGLEYYFMPMFWLSPAVIIGAWRLDRTRGGVYPRLVPSQFAG